MRLMWNDMLVSQRQRQNGMSFKVTIRHVFQFAPVDIAAGIQERVRERMYYTAFLASRSLYQSSGLACRITPHAWLRNGEHVEISSSVEFTSCMNSNKLFPSSSLNNLLNSKHQLQRYKSLHHIPRKRHSGAPLRRSVQIQRHCHDRT